MRGVFAGQTFDPVTEQFYLEEGSRDCTFRNLALNTTFYIRGSKNILVDGGSVGGTTHGENCKVGAAQSTLRTLCTNIVVRNIRFHDMTISDPTQHHEALYVSDTDGVLVEGCTFDRIYANTADLFFCNEQTPQLATNVTVRGCRFSPPTNGSRRDAIQWGDVTNTAIKPFANYLIEGNLFDGCEMIFGTLLKPVSNFVVGVNYGQLSAAQHDYAVKMGVTFLEYPFRPAADWPGAIVLPPPPPPPPPTDPCADVKAELAAAQAHIADIEAQIAGANQTIGSLQTQLASSVSDVAALQAKIRAAVADLA